MENPINHTDPMSRQLNPSSSGRRIGSPEFEFLTAATSPPLVTADELFVNGILLPLSLLHLHPNLHQQPDHPIQTIPDPSSTESLLKPDPSSSSSTTTTTTSSSSSKRYYWKDITTLIFKTSTPNKAADRKFCTNNATIITNSTTKKKKKNPTTTTMTGDGAADQLNSNVSSSSSNTVLIWPFSRSRSAGTGSTRPKQNPIRKSSSAPCSRSNSARKWPAGSPSRVGVHLGRASPVWQARTRPKPVNINNNNEAASRGKRSVLVGPPPVVRVLNLNVPMCIRGGGDGVVAGGEGTRGGLNMFNFRNMFTTPKKSTLVE